MELACKAGSGKVIAAFPDVCMTPPENPATPPGVPVPYPDTAMASDTTKGSKKVKISGKEIMLKNKSYFKTLTGNEAGCAAKKGVISSKIKGKVYFVKWSMNVKCEGENLCRHTDLTTNNHASPMANEAAPWPYTDSMSKSTLAKCEATYVKFKIHKHKDKTKNCSASKDSHHPVQNACFCTNRKSNTPYYSTPRYNQNEAPAICLFNGHKGRQHYRVNQKQNDWAKGLKKRPTYSELRKQEKNNLKEAVPMSEQEAECIMLIVDAYMKTIGVKKGDSTPLRKPG